MTVTALRPGTGQPAGPDASPPDPGGRVPEAAPVAAGRPVRRWPLFLIASPAAVAVWSGWVGLGALCGFGAVHPLPGIADSFQLNTAITLPVGVEAYGAYALGAWLAPATPATARRFARRSALGALALGMAGQVIYHLLAAAHATRAPWPVVVLVACLPVVTLGFGAALTHLLRTHPGPSLDGAPAGQPQAHPSPALVSAPGDGPAGDHRPPVPVPARSRTARSQRARPRRARRPRAAPEVGALMPLGWQAAADLAARGEPLTRDSLAAALRKAGHPAGNARVGTLLARLKTETPPHSPAPAAAEGDTPS